MIEKIIFIEFADPRIRAIEHFSDICEAVNYAQHNLYVRHRIRLHAPYQSNNLVFLKMEIPDESCENFNPGNHLRGMSKYLLKKHSDFYKNYRVGNRLLHYMPVNN